jgi:hypothetical protein
MRAVVSRARALRLRPEIKRIEGLPDTTEKADMRSTECRAARICRPQRQAGRLAASVQSELTDLFVVVVVVKVIALIVEHPLRYCRGVWMQEAGGLTTHDILRVAFRVPQSIGCGGSTSSRASEAVQRQPKGRPGKHPITTLWPPVTLEQMVMFVLSYCKICSSAHIHTTM